MSADCETLAYYEKHAPHYTLSFDQAPSRHLDRFLDRLEANATVLELGCGVGCDSARIKGRGFEVDATDGSVAMTRKANERFKIGARVMRFDELEVVARYDAVWAHASLIHVARSDLQRVLSAIFKALKPGGWHFANYKLGQEECRDPLGRLTNLPDAVWIETAYLESGFAIEETERYPGKGADGVQRDWYALTVRKERS